MKITVCIGSSCHLKGARRVVEQLQELIDEKELADEVDLGGRSCMGKCSEGVCAEVDGKFYSVAPDQVEEFFAEAVLTKVEQYADNTL